MPIVLIIVGVTLVTLGVTGKHTIVAERVKNVILDSDTRYLVGFLVVGAAAMYYARKKPKTELAIASLTLLTALSFIKNRKG